MLNLFLLEVNSSFSCQMEPRDCKLRRAYLELVYTFTLFSCNNSHALVNAISSAF